MEFRIFQSQQDKGRTIARISPELMKTFQINTGDVLRISGQPAAHAECLPLDTDKNTQKDLPEITFLNDHGKDLSQIFVSDAVFRNLMLWSGSGSKVTVKKTGLSTSTSSDKPITDALKIILATTPGFANNLGEHYKKRIDFEALHDMIVTKNDRIIAPMRTEENHRPQQFSSIILDVKPESQENIWRIRKDTQFEFENASLDVFSKDAPPRSGLHDLTRVIPIVQKIAIGEDIKVTIPSLEIYKNGSKINIYVTERLHEIKETSIPDFQTGKSRKMKQPIQKLQGIPRLNMEISDNFGNTYSVMPGGGSGNSGASFPSGEKDWEFYATSELSVLLMPLIGPDVNQLTVTINEMTWEDHMHMRMQLPPTKPPHMTKIEPGQMKMAIATGPWKFDIPINQQNN